MKFLGWLLAAVLACAGALAVWFFLSAVSPAEPGTESADRLKGAGHAVGSMDITFIDDSRPTRANGDFTGAPSRSLEATVWYPRDAADEHPLVIYSHGLMSTRRENDRLARLLASYGYVVVAMDFPLTNGAAPGGGLTRDVVNQPEDVRFTIDQVLAWKAGERPFDGEIDRERIAVVGLSLGGLTTELVTFHPRLRDPRIAAAVAIAGPTIMFTPVFFSTTDIPFLMIAGTADAIIPYAQNAAPLPAKIRRGGLLAIEGASHTGFADFADGFPLRLLANPDSLGCWAVANNFGSAEPENFFDELGGPEIGIDVDPQTSLPCQQEAADEALAASRQLAITRLAVAAFLESHFAREPSDRRAHATYLRKTLARDYPGVKYVSLAKPEKQKPAE